MRSMLGTALLLACVFTIMTTGGVIYSAGRSGLQQAEVGSISGRVETVDTPPRPVPMATVILSRINGERYIEQTTQDGRFSFSTISAGGYALDINKPAFLPFHYGPERPDGAFVLRSGEVRNNVLIKLIKGAVVSGGVRRSTGEAIVGAKVRCYRFRKYGPAPTDSPEGITDTDDRGQYRLYGLEAGSYLVVASPPSGVNTAASRPSNSEIESSLSRLQVNGWATEFPERAVRFLPTWSGNSLSSESAQAVVVNPSEERAGVDFELTPTSVTTISGIVESSFGGSSTAAVSVRVLPSDGGVTFPESAPLQTKSPGADGRFAYEGVSPGRYRVWAFSTSLAGPTGAVRFTLIDSGRQTKPALPPAPELRSDTIVRGAMWAFADIAVAPGEPVLGLVLELRPAIRILGNAINVGDPGAAPTQVSISLIPQDVSGDPAIARRLAGLAPTPGNVNVRDGRFELNDVFPGTYRVSVVASPPVWHAVTAMHAGVDLIDTPLSVDPYGPGTVDLRLTLTNKGSSVRGALVGLPPGNRSYYVVMFPSDEALRSAPRRVLRAWPGSDGQFAFPAVIPGVYLVAATMTLGADDWRDPVFLNRLKSGAATVTVGEGQLVVQDLRIR
jgi:hypothetical protein